MKSIVVFCGSSEGYNEVYKDTAYELGAVLAERNIHLIYGGGKVGLMGALADGCLANKGKVTGVIPRLPEDQRSSPRGTYRDDNRRHHASAQDENA